MVLIFQDPRERGGRPQKSSKFLPYFWLRDMGGDPMDGTPTSEFPPQVGKKASGDSTEETEVWDLVIPPSIM